MTSSAVLKVYYGTSFELTNVELNVRIGISHWRHDGLIVKSREDDDGFVGNHRAVPIVILMSSRARRRCITLHYDDARFCPRRRDERDRAPFTCLRRGCTMEVEYRRTGGDRLQLLPQVRTIDRIEMSALNSLVF